MTTAEIISAFETYVDDSTELSTSEELRLAEKIYRKILNDRPWEFLKTSYTGTVTGTTMTLPDDFGYIISNDSYTDNTTDEASTKRPSVVFIGSNYQPYNVVNWSDRLRYRNNANTVWLDIKNNNLVFSVAQTGSTVTFDYVYNPPALTAETSPVFPSRFHDMMVHGMAADDYMIQQFDKAKSYRDENKKEYKEYLTDMQYYNAQTLQN